MKRLLPLLIGIVLLLPSTASAQGSAIGDLSRIAVSPAVARTLERAASGMDAAWQSPIGSFFDYMTGEWWGIAMSGVSQMEEGSLSAEQRLSMTSCQRVDLFLLEQALRDVRENIRQAVDARRVSVILRLRDLHKFLAERHAALSRLGTDPLGIDTGWGTARLFEAGEQIYSTPMCPFTTDYLPSTLGTQGYGCDADMLDRILQGLESISGTPGTEALFSSIALEHDGLRGMENALTRSVFSAEHLREVQEKIAELEGIPPTDLPPPLPYELGGGHEPAATGCNAEIPDGLFFHSLTDTFSIEANHRSLLSAFRAARREEGGRRALPSFLRESEDREDPGTSALRMQGADGLEDYGRTQGEKEAETFAAAIDPLLTMQESLRNFAISVGRLSSLAVDMDGGIRGAVRDFAYFLSRSCMNRTCGTRLDAVLKILYADECFPFTSGQFALDTADDPRARKCKEAAGL